MDAGLPLPAGAAGRTTAGNTTSPSVSYLLFIAFLFFVMSGGNSGRDADADTRLEHAIARRSVQLSRFNDWIHGNASLPLPVNETAAWNNTFELKTWKEDTIVQPLINQLLHLDSTNAVYYHNISGFLNGQYDMLNVSLPGSQLNTSKDKPEWDTKRGVFPWKIGNQARVYLKVREHEPTEGKDRDLDEQVSFIRGAMEFRTDNDESGTEVDVEGVHCLKNGSFFMFGAPSQLPLDIRQLPALLPSSPSTPTSNLTGTINTALNQTVFAVQSELAKRIQRMQSILREGEAQTLTDGDEVESSVNCTFAIVGQLDAVPYVAYDQMRLYEKELAKPTGRKLPHVAPLTWNAVVHSADCNLLIQVKNVSGTNGDYFWYGKSTHFAFFLGIISLIQVVLIVRQMEKCNTPSRLVKVSYWTVVAQGALDSYSFVAHLTLGSLVDERAAFALFVPAFFACLSGFLFGLRWCANIRLATIPSSAPAVTTPAPTIGTEVTATQSAAVASTERPRSWRDIVAGDSSPIWLILFYGGMSSVAIFFVYFGFAVCSRLHKCNTADSQP